MKRSMFILFLILFLSVFVLSSAQAESLKLTEMAKITDVKINKENQLEIIICTDRKVAVKKHILSKPACIILDIENAWLAPNVKKIIEYKK